MKTKETLFFPNRKATFNYTVVDDYNAGLVLTGVQIKAIRAGKVNITEGFCKVENGAVFTHNIILDGQTYNNIKLLLQKKEIKKIAEAVKLENRTIIPLNIHFSNQYAKMKIGLCKGKKLFDKRETIKKRDLERSES